MQTQPLHFGLIGAGAQGRRFGHFLRYSEFAPSIVAVVDSDEQQLRKAVDELKFPGLKCFSRITKEFLRIVDAVIVATPPRQRMEVVMPLIEAGKHVICENPLAFTSQNVWDIARAAALKKVVVTVDEQWRWLRGVMLAERWVREGKIGSLQRCEIEGKGRDAIVELERIGSHLLSVAMHCFVGSEIQSLSRERFKVKSGLEALLGTLVMTTGKVLQVTLWPALEADVRSCRLELIGDAGRLRLVGGLLENVWHTPHPSDTDEAMDAPKGGWRKLCLGSGIWSIDPGQEEQAMKNPEMNPSFSLVQGAVRAMHEKGENPYPPCKFAPVAEAMERLYGA